MTFSPAANMLGINRVAEATTVRGSEGPRMLGVTSAVLHINTLTFDLCSAYPEL